MSNHCGPFWFPEWSKKILSEKFNSACEVHDNEYRLQRVTRLDADRMLLDNMYNLCKEKKDFIIAFIMYLAVRVGGWISWRRNAQ